MKALVLYHGNCPDGFTAAWAVWKALGDRAEYREVNYGQGLPNDVGNRRVILVDFSYPKPLLDNLAVLANSVEVYDHHKTAQADLADWKQGKIVFDLNRSGAGIAWDEMVRLNRIALVNYVEDRDLWRWLLPYSREVSEYLFSLPRTFEEWDKVSDLLETEGAPPLDVGFRWVVDQGTTLLRAKRIRVETVCKNIRWMTFKFIEHAMIFGTIRIPVVNTAWDFSEIGEYLCERFPEASAGGYYFDREDKRQWGFRSRGGFDVSNLCRMYGGGGHKAAAGFTSEIGWEPS